MNKLVIFDCDGVLVDSEMIASHVEAEALTKYGYKITAEESIKKFTGVNANTARQQILDESGIHLPDSFYESKLDVLLHAFENNLNALNSSVIKKLVEMRVSRCVASSSPRNRVIKCLELTQHLDLFSDDSIFTSQQVKKGKPAPDLFLFAASQLDYSPKQCVVIEDSEAGIQAAKAAGMHVIGFLGGSHAQFDWYSKLIHAQRIPIAKNSDELLVEIQAFLDS